MIRVQPIEGVWQTLGGDLYPGVEPEGVTPVWGPNGPESLSFSLARPPARVHADLLPGTPVEWYPGGIAAGEPLWSGYTMLAPPGGLGEMTSVSCVGWHYYREDHPGAALYVHDDLTAWADVRSWADANLAEFTATWGVEVGVGGVTITYPGPHRASGGWPRAGVFLDLGPSARSARVFVEWERSGAWAGTSTLALAGTDDTPGVVLVGSTVATISAAGANSGSLGVTVANRYIVVTLDANTIQSPETWLRLKALRVFVSASYESSGASVFRADAGIKAARDRFCPQLSSDNSRIAAVTFPIRHAAWLDEDATARQQMDAFNDYHGYKLGVDAGMRVFFEPQPSVPRLQVDALTPGVSYRSTSTNDGSEIFNCVSVRGRSGAGVELRQTRYTGEYLTLPAADGVDLTNPSFDTSATGWSTGVARITSVFDSSPGAGFASGQTSYTGSMTGGTFLKGVPYVITWRSRWSVFDPIRIQFGSSTDYGEVTVRQDVLDTYQSYSIAWIPRADVAAGSVTWRLLNGLAVVGYYLDTFRLSGGTATIWDRRRRVRSFTLNVAAATDAVSMDALARAFLLAHRTVPHKANLTISADDVVLDLQSGPVAQGDLGRYYGEMVRVLSVPDPDTGALQSRDGVIASVQGAGPVSVALDSERRSLEALMARMGVSGSLS